MIAIGEKIIVSGLAKPIYETDDKNVMWRKWIKVKIEPRIGYCTGYAYKREGYISGGYYNPYRPKEYRPKFLSGVTTVLLVKVKFHPKENDKFAFNEDVIQATPY